MKRFLQLKYHLLSANKLENNLYVTQTKSNKIMNRNRYNDKNDDLSNNCEEMINIHYKKAGIYRKEDIIISSQSSEILLENGKKLINFSSSDYLGLTNSPELVSIFKESVESHGYGMSSVRYICGTQDIHKQLEKSIANFYGQEDAILYTSCFDANCALFQTIFDERDAIISDSLNHASTIDGIRLCKAKRFIYEHIDIVSLEFQLKKASEKSFRFKVITTDGVFSMDGDIAPLDQIVSLAKKYGAYIFLDESHATGVLGKNGKGTAEYFGVEKDIDITSSTLGKALGGANGGYITAKKEVIELLRLSSRPYIFSNSLIPPIVKISIRVFEILNESSELTTKLKQNIKIFRSEMSKLGFELMGHKDSAIIPILLKDANLVAKFCKVMKDEGIFVVGFGYPVVPKMLDRIRTTVSAKHTKEQILHAVKIFEKVGKRYNII